MVGQWAASYVSKQIPELRTEPIRIWLHIAAEMATALALIAGGMCLLALTPGASILSPVSVGMLLCTAIVSPGYFAQRGRWTWVLAFGVLIALAIVSLCIVSS